MFLSGLLRIKHKIVLGEKICSTGCWRTNAGCYLQFAGWRINDYGERLHVLDDTEYADGNQCRRAWKSVWTDVFR